MSELTRRTFFKTAAAATLAAASGLRGEERRGPPNVLLITCDDLHGDAMGWAGGAVGNTPHLDALARQSFGFLNMHTAAPICQPSREALMTGLVPHRNGGVGFNPIRLDVTTLPEVLSRHGYFTGVVNKLGHMQPALRFPWDWKRERGEGEGFITTSTTSARNPINYHADILEAVGEAKRSGKPFFFNFNVTDPHRPFYQSPADLRMGGVTAPDLVADPKWPVFLDDLPGVRSEIHRYYRSVRRADVSVGEILRGLAESGAEQDTLVVFVADHGMPFPFSKTTLYYGGTHTPCLFRCPQMPAGGIDTRHMPSNTDIMPTVLELLGIAAPPGLDGRSLLPLLKVPDSSRQEVFTYVTSLSDGSIFPGRCWRTLQRSYIWNPWSDGHTRFHNESMQGQSYPAMVQAAKTSPEAQARLHTFLYRAPEQFFDLEKDPAERNNLVQAAEYGAEVAEARRHIRAQMIKSNDPLLSLFTPI